MPENMDQKTLNTDTFYAVLFIHAKQKHIKNHYHFQQGGLNKREIQLNLCNIFLFWYLMHSLYSPNHVKLERAVIFMKYLSNVVSLIFLSKTLIWNKTTFPTSSSLNFAGLVDNEFIKSISKKDYQYYFFYPIYHCFLKMF